MGTRFQFSLKHLFGFLTTACLLLGLAYYLPLAAFMVIFANLVGLIMGLFVTHVLKIPNDGSYSCPEESDDDEDDDSPMQ